jgi:hypothetical protein
LWLHQKNPLLQIVLLFVLRVHLLLLLQIQKKICCTGGGTSTRQKINVLASAETEYNAFHDSLPLFAWVSKKNQTFQIGIVCFGVNKMLVRR